MPLWSLFLLILVGSAALLVEFFIPAFGIVGLVGFTTVVAAVAVGFSQQAEPWGLLLLLTALIVTPTVVIGGFRRFPKSFFGKRMILATDEGSSPRESDDGVTVGMEGRAVTPLHPGGVAELDGRRKSVVTGGEYIDPGTKIEVIVVEGARIVVRRKDDGN